MARPIRVLTINHNDEQRRIRVVLIDDSQRYRWIEEETGNDTEVSAITIKAAISAAKIAWGSPVWGLHFGH